MSTFGEKLRAERERRNTPLSDVSARTRIGMRYLEALERDDFDELPGPRGFGKLYIRAYAEMLGFDPAPLIREYDEIVHRRLREAGEDSGEPARQRLRRIRYVPPPRAATNGGGTKSARNAADDDPELPELDDAEDETSVAGAVDDAFPAPTVTSIPAGRSAQRGRQIGAAVGALLVVVTLGVMLRGQRAPLVEPAANDPIIDDAAESVGVLFELDTAAIDPAPAPAPVVARRAPDASLRITSAGVGSGVSNLRLVGEASSFREGQVVSFLTRVRGGTVGQRIRHVWICDGRTVQSIPLTLGGDNWRTFSNKTVWSLGDWAVEARDAGGRLLARAEFDVRRIRR